MNEVYTDNELCIGALVYRETFSVVINTLNQRFLTIKSFRKQMI